MNGATDVTSQLLPGSGLSITNISSFGEDGFGELYLTDITDGEIYKLTTVPEPASVAFVALIPLLFVTRRHARRP
jgi:hypothetical protein